MKLTLKPEPIFTVCINGREHKGFRVVSEWEGFKKLQRNMDVLIVATTSCGGPMAKAMDHVFARWMGDKPLEELWLVMASPNLIGELSAETSEPPVKAAP